MKVSEWLMVTVFFAALITTGGSLWAQNSIVTGSWGGEHIGLLASETNAAFELDCAHGEINGPLVLFDQDGSFSIEGMFTLEHGGPVFPGEQPDIHPALYTGIVYDDLMEMMITLTDSGQEIGIFDLVKDRQPLLFKCL